jgi:hypothetical protein
MQDNHLIHRIAAGSALTFFSGLSLFLLGLEEASEKSAVNVWLYVGGEGIATLGALGMAAALFMHLLHKKYNTAESYPLLSVVSINNAGAEMHTPAPSNRMA